MEQFHLIVQQPSWYIGICIIVGAAFSYLLYGKIGKSNPMAKATWGTSTHYLLAALRGISIALLCFLLLRPAIQQLKSITQPPEILLAIDNSESLTLAPTYKTINSSLNALQDQLKAIGYNTIVTDFSGGKNSIDSISYNWPTTDLYKLLSDAAESNDGRNIGAAILLSDGGQNKGEDPSFINFKYPHYTLGVGDTVARKDVFIKYLDVNKIAYLGNKFPLQAEIGHVGYANAIVNVVVESNGKRLATQNITLGNSGSATANFLLEAKQKGYQNLKVSVAPLQLEYTIKNNTGSTYIEVIDGKERILIVGESPHPDIKAIASALATEANYEVVIYLPVLGGVAPKGNFDAVIAHGLPTNGNDEGTKLVKALADKKVPIWYIISSSSSTTSVSDMNNALSIVQRGNKPDAVSGVYNSNFKRFDFDPDLSKVFPKLPPMMAPFADYALKAGADVLLSQRIGSADNGKPLLALNQSLDTKTAVLAAEGIWQWRLQEFNDNGNQNATDGLIKRVVQFLSAKSDKRKFRLAPLQPEIDKQQRAIFSADLYNDIYQPIYNTSIALTLQAVTSEDKGGTKPAKYLYNFSTSAESNKFEVPLIPPGLYTYKASASINNKPETVTGELLVRDQQIELLYAGAANTAMLKAVANTSGGTYYPLQDANKLVESLKLNQPKALVKSFESISLLLENVWLMALIIALLITEWTIRKYAGGY